MKKEEETYKCIHDAQTQHTDIPHKENKRRKLTELVIKLNQTNLGKKVSFRLIKKNCNYPSSTQWMLCLSCCRWDFVCPFTSADYVYTFALIMAELVGRRTEKERDARHTNSLIRRHGEPSDQNGRRTHHLSDGRRRRPESVDEMRRRGKEGKWRLDSDEREGWREMKSTETGISEGKEERGKGIKGRQMTSATERASIIVNIKLLNKICQNSTNNKHQGSKEDVAHTKADAITTAMHPIHVSFDKAWLQLEQPTYSFKGTKKTFDK